jgi:DNA invertase Pin-like site-specific DNA recombinase
VAGDFSADGSRPLGLHHPAKATSAGRWTALRCDTRRVRHGAQVCGYNGLGASGGTAAAQVLMRAAPHYAFACMPVWKFDRLARSVSHVLRALEAFNHLRAWFMRVQEQVATASPMGQAMVTISGAMAESAASLLSERVQVGMAAARARGKRLGRPATPDHLVSWIEALPGTTGRSVRQIQKALAGKVSCYVVGDLVKRVREPSHTTAL